MRRPALVRALPAAVLVVLLAGCGSGPVRETTASATDVDTGVVDATDVVAQPQPEASTAAPDFAGAAPVSANATTATEPAPGPSTEPDPVDSPGLPPPLDTGSAVFAVLRAHLATQQCEDDRVVTRWLERYARAPSRLAANLERVLPLLAHVTGRLRDAGLPGEFALLPIVESWYRPDARHAGTSGLWQFSAATARAHGLRVDAVVDQRLAPAAATVAAMDHLQTLMARFGDWRLATMAYNAGAYRLGRAHAADPAEPSPQHHQPAGLRMGTYEHLAKLQALACLVIEPGRIGLELPAAAFTPLSAEDLAALDARATPTPSREGPRPE